MSLILHIDSSTPNCSVCLGKDGQPWIIRQLQDAAGHAEQITLFIQEIMQTADLPLSALDAIAVSKGPGSYTGLRIGISTAKGLCYALDKPLIAIDTLQALAWAARHENNQRTAVYIGMLDARRQDAYVGIYDQDLNPIAAPYFCTIKESSFVDYYSNNKTIILAGDATKKTKNILMASPSIVYSRIELPSSRYLCALAKQKMDQAQYEDIAYFEPFYLKKPHITKAKPRF